MQKQICIPKIRFFKFTSDWVKHYSILRFKGLLVWFSHLMWLSHSSRTTSYDSLSEWLVTDQSFSPGTLVSSTNKHWYQGRILKLEKIRFFGVKSGFFTRNTPKIFAPPYAIGKNMTFWCKIVIFHTKYPKHFRASLYSAQFF